MKIMNNKKLWIAALLTISSSMGAVSSVFAFSDMKNDPNRSMAEALETRGIVKGVTEDRFAPKQKLTAAEGLQMIINVLHLQPGADESSRSEQKKAWYDSAVQIAKDNGIAVDDIKDWNAPLTRERFATMLYQGIQSTGKDDVHILSYIEVTDDGQMSASSREPLQFLLRCNIVKLDQQHKFYPKQNITRTEAAGMIYRTYDFMKSHKKHEEPGGMDYVAAVNVEKINDQINKITLTVQQLPNSGYGVVLDRIEFQDDKRAIAYYSISTPKPGMMCPQVISKASTSFYIASQYEVKAQLDGMHSPTPEKNTTDKSSLK